MPTMPTMAHLVGAVAVVHRAAHTGLGAGARHRHRVAAAAANVVERVSRLDHAEVPSARGRGRQRCDRLAKVDPAHHL